MEELILFSQKYKLVFTLIHSFFSAVGIGGVLVLDILFLKFLKDRKISESEKEILNYLSRLFWVSFFFIFVSGIFLYFTDMERFHNSSKFLTKIAIVFIIFINGLILNLYIGPKLENFSLDNKFKTFTLISLFSGIVSFVSWTWAFVLGSLKAVPFSVGQLLLIYLFSILVIFFLVYLKIKIGKNIKN